MTLQTPLAKFGSMNLSKILRFFYRAGTLKFREKFQQFVTKPEM